MTAHSADQGWVQFVAAHLHPKEVRDCSGEQEFDALESELRARGTWEPVTSGNFKDCLVERVDANAVVGIEHAIHVCAKEPALVGPGAQFLPQNEAMQRIWPMFHRSAVDATLYSIPYALGASGSSVSQSGRLLTNNPALASKFARLVHVDARSAASDDRDRVRVIHLDGLGRERGLVCYFPDRRIIWAVGIDADTFLHHHAHTLRLASWQTADQGWLPIRANVLHVTSPRGDAHHILCAPPLRAHDFPAAFRGLEAGGWGFQILPSSVLWMHVDESGVLRAIFPERATILDLDGMPLSGNGVLSRALQDHALFRGVALTRNKQPWWQGMGHAAVYPMLDWSGRERTDPSDHLSAHHACAYAVPPRKSEWERAIEQPGGLPISAIAFVAHRRNVVPLVAETTGWDHGTLAGVTLQNDSRLYHDEGGEPLVDPMGMRSSCLCSLSDYIVGWLSIGRQLRKAPKVYRLNPSRTNAQNEPLLPDATVAFPWIVQRVEGSAQGRPTVTGFVPTEDSLGWTGLDAARRTELLRVDPTEWLGEVERSELLLAQLGKALPFELRREQAHFSERVQELARMRPSI